MASEKKADVIVTDNAVYDVEVFDFDNTIPKYGKAYILKEDFGDDDIFYIYRGSIKRETTYPGIYLDKSTNVSTFVEPTAEERPDYLIKSHLSNLSPGEMLVVLKNNRNIQHVYTEDSKLYIPEVLSTDNILKRVLKTAFQVKNVTIEQCKDGFTDRNAFFNFSSVMRSKTGNVSFLLMDRGCSSMNLGYAIVLYELDPENPIGKSLNDPEVAQALKDLPISVSNPIVTNGIVDLNGKIIASSEDSYAIA